MTKLNDTLEKCLSAKVDEEGLDISLITGLDFQRLMQYGKLRKELSEKYPNPKYLREDAEDTIDIKEAKYDSKAPLFLKLMLTCKNMYERIGMLQEFATEYDKKVVRFYAHITLNWPNQGKGWLKILGNQGMYEVVESYFKVIRKYALSTEEEPYYFLSPGQKRKIQYEGEMLKRSTQFDDSEIKLSFLEGLE